MRLERSVALALPVLLGSLLVAGSPAAAGRKPPPGPPPENRFGCLASLVRVDVLGAELEPVVANRPSDPCANDDDGVHNGVIDLRPTAEVAVSLKLLWADTVNQPAHSAHAETGVADLSITVPGATVRAEVLTASASAVCPGPGLTSESTVVGVTLNGLPVDVPRGQASVTVPIPLVGSLHLNRTTTGTDQVTRQALVLDTALADVVVAEAVADFHGAPCGKPTRLPREPRGWMTGGGWVDGAQRVSHGMRLECRAPDGPNNLQISWPGNGFHLESVTEARCSDDPAAGEGQPPAGFDTISVKGTGRCRGGGTASISFSRMTDAGEPGDGDRFEVTIAGDCPLAVSGALGGGNHQAHRRV